MTGGKSKHFGRTMGKVRFEKHTILLTIVTPVLFGLSCRSLKRFSMEKQENKNPGESWLFSPGFSFKVI